MQSMQSQSSSPKLRSNPINSFTFAHNFAAASFYQTSQNSKFHQLMDKKSTSSSSTTKFDRWDYPIQTKSEDCIDAVNSYYEQFLTYGRNRTVIIKALTFDPNCVLANALAAYHVASKEPTRAAELLDAAATLLVGLLFWAYLLGFNLSKIPWNVSGFSYQCQILCIW